MSRIESRIKQFTARLVAVVETQGQVACGRVPRMARRRAASRARDFRESERGQPRSKQAERPAGQRARQEGGGPRSATCAPTDAAKKAESAPDRPAPPRARQEGRGGAARKVMHDLFSGGSGSSGTTGDAS